MKRHRHCYEVNIAYREKLEAAGLKMSGLSPDGLLPEIVEREDHPWFVAVQFHPELKSCHLARTRFLLGCGRCQRKITVCLKTGYRVR